MSLSPAIHSFEEGSVFNEDVKIIYRDYGPKDAEPILLVQGLGGQLINWPDLAVFSAALFTVMLITPISSIANLLWLSSVDMPVDLGSSLEVH